MTSPAANPSNPTLGYLACGGAAVLGALLWGAIAFYAGMEHGIIAWGVGGLVGGACTAVGGRGNSLAFTAAVFALVAILGGKYFVYDWSWGKALGENQEMRATYEELKTDAVAFAALGESPDEAAIEDFMLDRNFTQMTVAEFRSNWVERLREFQAEQPDYDTWVQGFEDTIRAEAGFTFVAYLQEDFHLFDILFVILGIATAFSMVIKATDDQGVDAMRRAKAASRREEARQAVAEYSKGDGEVPEPEDAGEAGEHRSD